MDDKLNVATLLADLGFDSKADLDNTLRWALIELKLRRGFLSGLSICAPYPSEYDEDRYIRYPEEEEQLPLTFDPYED